MSRKQALDALEVLGGVSCIANQAELESAVLGVDSGERFMRKCLQSAMHPALRLITCLLFIAHALQAHGAEEVVVTSTTFFVLTRGGQPAVCGVEYQIVFRDRTGRQGALTGAYGGLNWLSAPDKPIVLMLKVGGIDFDQRTQQAIGKFPVLRGFIAIDSKPVAPLRPMDCEDRQEFCAVYPPNTAKLVLSSMLPREMRKPPTGDLSLGLQRQTGGLDLVVPLEVTRESLASNEFKSFVSCMKILDQ